MSCGRGIEPVVKTVQGLVRGRVAQSKTPRGGKYFSFQGIPYAQPPVGPLRFAAPQPAKPWSGIKDALKEAKICPSLNYMYQDFVEDSSEEECLSLNVYTSQLPGGDADKKRPVMVWIHGGAFEVGSGNTDFYGPDHLVVRDVVVVTINYRLSVLGFLSLGNDACPGNNGLKDQVEALRWVKTNIAAFGGDPDNVTIFGESAGAASVQYLMLSPLSKGLFQRAISQSGSVLCPWATSQKPVESAFKLGEVLGMKTTDKEKLLDFLRIVPARTLVALAHTILKKVDKDIAYLSSGFNPCVEPASAGAFISESPEDLVKAGKLHDVPYVVGVNTLEGLIVGLSPAGGGLPPLHTKEEQQRLLPVHPKLKLRTPLADSILDKIRQFYFPNGYDEKQAADILSSVYFWSGNYEVLESLASAPNRKSKTYYYVFSYDGGLSLFKPLLGFNSWKGTLHADEIQYLLCTHMVPLEIAPDGPDHKVLDTMCRLWIDFAVTGDPTPDTKLWQAYNSSSRPYLNIDEQLVAKNNAYADQMEFWSGIYAQINDAVPAKL